MLPSCQHLLQRQLRLLRSKATIERRWKFIAHAINRDFLALKIENFSAEKL